MGGWKIAKLLTYDDSTGDSNVGRACWVGVFGVSLSNDDDARRLALLIHASHLDVTIERQLWAIFGLTHRGVVASCCLHPAFAFPT